MIKKTYTNKNINGWSVSSKMLESCKQTNVYIFVELKVQMSCTYVEQF